VHSHGPCLLDKGPNFCLQFTDERHRDLGSGIKHHCVIFIVEKGICATTNVMTSR